MHDVKDTRPSGLKKQENGRERTLKPWPSTQLYRWREVLARSLGGQTAAFQAQPEKRARVLANAATREVNETGYSINRLSVGR